MSAPLASDSLDTPTNDLRDTGASNTFFQHDFGSVKLSGPLVATSIISFPRINAQSNGRPV